jgi:putative transposase
MIRSKASVGIAMVFSSAVLSGFSFGEKSADIATSGSARALSESSVVSTGRLFFIKPGPNATQEMANSMVQLRFKETPATACALSAAPHNTSRTCPCCGHVSKDNRQIQAKFLCVDCGYENHADVVGAINILERGYRLLACGESAQSGRSLMQEPTEAT